MYSQGLPCTGRDSILVRLMPMKAIADSADTSDPGRCSSENARLILFDSGSVTASAARRTRKKRVIVFRVVFDAGFENLRAVILRRRLAGDGRRRAGRAAPPIASRCPPCRRRRRPPSSGCAARNLPALRQRHRMRKDAVDLPHRHAGDARSGCGGCAAASPAPPSHRGSAAGRSAPRPSPARLFSMGITAASTLAPAQRRKDVGRKRAGNNHPVGDQLHRRFVAE